MKVGNNIQDKGGKPYTCRVPNNEALGPISTWAYGHRGVRFTKVLSVIHCSSRNVTLSSKLHDLNSSEHAMFHYSHSRLRQYENNINQNK